MAHFVLLFELDDSLIIDLFEVVQIPFPLYDFILHLFTRDFLEHANCRVVGKVFQVPGWTLLDSTRKISRAARGCSSSLLLLESFS